MKIMKNAAYDYAKNNIDENNGYTKWYDREKMKRKRNVFMIWMRLGLFIAFSLCAKFISGAFKASQWGIGDLIIAIIATSFLVVMPLRDLIKLSVVSGFKLDGKCLLSCYKDPGSVYNGFVTKKRIVTSLIIPLVIFVAIFSPMLIFTRGVLQAFALVMLIISVYMTLEDLFMLVYCVKHIDKDEIVFGEYKKSSF